MGKRFASVAVVMLVVAFMKTATLGAVSIVINGGFETGSFSGWTQTGNTTFNGVQCPGPGPTVAEGNCSAFFGPIGSIGGITQTLTTTPGTAYDFAFSFLPDGGAPSSFAALFNGVTLLSFTNPPASATYRTFNLLGFATSNSTPIAFNFRDDPGFLFLDNVSVVATPEPASLVLVGAGAIALARKRLKKRA